MKIKLDFWKMNDIELFELAEKYQLLSEPELESLAYDYDKGQLNPNYDRNLLSQENREKIIESLTKRIGFIRSFITILISGISLIISIFALLK